MPERMFLYIDILGFGDMVKNGGNVNELYSLIDDLNVHRDRDFTTIVFSDTIVVYGSEGWLAAPHQAVMWLIEYAQDLFYRLSFKDIHFRAYITKGNFEHYKLNHLEAYYGSALVECFENEKDIKAMGVFLDKKLSPFSNVFFLSPYNDKCDFVHVMQHIDDISYDYKLYPIKGDALIATGMEWWVAYLLRYISIIYNHSQDANLNPNVREKYTNTWNLISLRHNGLLRRLAEANFSYGKVVQMDWSEPLARIGTDEGAWG